MLNICEKPNAFALRVKNFHLSAAAPRQSSAAHGRLPRTIISTVAPRNLLSRHAAAASEPALTDTHVELVN
jgi:hypothetical protein